MMAARLSSFFVRPSSQDRISVSVTVQPSFRLREIAAQIVVRGMSSHHDGVSHRDTARNGDVSATRETLVRTRCISAQSRHPQCGDLGSVVGLVLLQASPETLIGRHRISLVC